jgi:hypothetical protein
MLNRLQGEYDAVFSLGGHCLPSIQLDKNGLRPYAGPIDWMISGSLSDVNRLLAARFAGFMEYSNMVINGHDYGGYNYLLEDMAYHITAAHHFPVSVNSPGNLVSYPDFKATLDRRISRFLDKMDIALKILLVRVGGFREQVVELEAVLSSIIKHDFRILFVEYTGSRGVRELDWGLGKVVSVELPPEDIWNGHDELWRYMLEEVRLSN